MVSLEPWDEVWRRNQHLADGLLRADPDTRVLLVEPGTDPLHDLRRGRRPRRGPGLEPINGTAHDGRLWRLADTKWLPRRVWSGYDRHWARGIVRAARRLDMTAPVLWANDPRAAHVLRLGIDWWTLYDITDDWLSANRPTRERERLGADEDLLLERAAEVVACSPEIQRRKSGRRAVQLIPNGVDRAHLLRGHPRPADLPAGRCVMYVGTLHRDRLDVELLVRTADAVAGHAQVVLVGPNALSIDDRKTLQHNGIHILGVREHTMVPAYLQHTDVLIVPHVVDAFTASLDPIKRYEYAAAGRPTVTTAVVGFSDGVDGVRVASRAAFASAVREALDQPAPEPARDVPTWEARVEEIRHLLPG